MITLTCSTLAEKSHEIPASTMSSRLTVHQLIGRSAMSSPLLLEEQRESFSNITGLRRIINSFFTGPFTGPEIPDDIAEQQLKAQISQSNQDEQIFLTHLLRDYRRFKNAPGFLVINQILQCWTFVEGLSSDDVQCTTFIRMTNCLAY